MHKLDLFNKTFKITFLIIVIIETFSFLGNNIEIINTILFFLIILATLLLSIWKLEIGFWIIAAELFIGSFGYLFSFDINEFRISIRLAIFVSVLIGFMVNVIRTRRVIFFKSSVFKSWILLMIIFIMGIIIGIINDNNLKNIFFDFNAYLFFGLILIAFQVINSWSRINKLIQILFAAIATIGIKTIFLLFYFSHILNESLFKMMYRWIRDTRVGEISPVIQNYYRIFFQGHIWAMFTAIIIFLILILLKRKDISKKNYKILWWIGIVSSIILIISFSRSLWLATVLSFILIFLYLLLKERFSWNKIFKISAFILLIIIIDLTLITAIVNVKIPKLGGGGVSIATLVKDRISDTSESAVISRFELLTPLTNKFFDKPIIGSGFGTEVSFKSADPRTENINDGIYTTYSFEWGYLDILVKIGLLGLLVYFYFIFQIFKNGIEILKSANNKEEYVITLGLIFCMVALLITHITTPYLNHPLGIFLIIIVAAIFSALKINNTQKDLK